MARNKYPEVTVERILDVAERLFLEKGYDNTTIQNIVDELGGLTKGAIYHHFKSKEEIMDALGDRMFSHNNPFEAVKKRRDLTGLEKMRLAILLNQSDERIVELTRQSIPLLKNPHILTRMIEINRRILCSHWLELIREGQEDGSIHTERPQELSQLLVLLDLWFIPSLFPGSKEEMERRYRFAAELLEKMGLPLYNREIQDLIRNLPYFPEADSSQAPD